MEEKPWSINQVQKFEEIYKSDIRRRWTKQARYKGCVCVCERESDEKILKREIFKKEKNLKREKSK